ncbi:DGQHR domain-containing protein [Hydrogenophaga sp. IBVHS2]|uniref:DGQHR domain-containing protein n=1 Tax=Hydrogenophaga sp. IBVHS2 TaxID=1985170 RepID=UPI0015C4E8D2|nr:DGQHR domain-containing protein [Hydrogenophaga sp. IBVHS2]
MNELNTLDQELEELAAMEAKRRRHLTTLLDEVTKVQNKYLAFRGEMGRHMGVQGRWHRTPSYVVNHDLAWIGANINMGSDMPFMKNKIQDGLLTIDRANIDEIQQRMPDWSRQAELSAYLAHNKHRKFGPILAVVSPGWVNDPQHENWSSDQRALKGAIGFEALDSGGRVGLIQLDPSQVSIYALDGQHRLMGIKGLADLQANKLYLKDKTGKVLNLFPREDFFKEIGLDDVELQNLLGERLHIEYIPAILPGETRNEAVRRVRSVFYALNAYAKQPTKGETLLLSETDGYAIVARRVGVNHPLLRTTRNGQTRDRVNWGGSALPDGSEWYTTLEALKEMVQSVLRGARPQLIKAFDKKWKRVELRPDDEQLDDASAVFSDFLTRVHDLPVFQAIERSSDPVRELAEFRRFENGRGHLLLRPIGQQILAEAVGQLIVEGMALDKIFEALQDLDAKGRFEAHRYEHVWYGVTYDFHNKKMDTQLSHRKLAVKLLMYLVRGAADELRRQLERELLPMRVIDTESKTWRDFSGNVAAVNIEADSEGRLTYSAKGMVLPMPRS